MTISFLCTLETAKPLATLLNCLYKRVASFHLTQEGIQITIRDQQCLQMNCYFKSTSASQYILSQEMEFNIDIQSLKQCLTIFGSEDTKASCEMRLGDHGLLISMKENDIITDCELAMFDYQPLIDLDSMFFNDSIMVKIMMHSDWIRTAFMEIDATCEFIEFQVSRDSSELTFSSQGLAGESKIRYPSNSLVMDSFFCEYYFNPHSRHLEYLPRHPSVLQALDYCVYKYFFGLSSTLYRVIRTNIHL